MFDTLKTYPQGSLRDYQIENKFKVYDSWKANRAVMLQMPTGTGKTYVIASIIKDLREYGKSTNHPLKILVLAHREEIIDQIRGTIKRLCHVDCGTIKGVIRENPRRSVQVASPQTLKNRLERWKEKKFDFIIIDEVHHTLAESYRNILDTFPQAKVLGVTATPYRMSGVGFTNEYDDLVVSKPVSQFIEDGVLSSYEYYSIGSDSYIQHAVCDLSKISNGDYEIAEMLHTFDVGTIRADVVKSYLDYAKGKKGIVYAISQKHCRHLCEAYKNAGIIAEYVDANTSADERKSIIDRFKSGEIKVLCNVDVFTEGFDCPDIEFIQLVRPTKSLALYLQQVGRGLRAVKTKKGETKKGKCIIIDNVGLYNCFDFPSAIRFWNYHFKGDKQIEETERQKLNYNPNNRKVREPNFDEGKEEVHLIESTSHLEFGQRKIELFKSVYERTHKIIVDCVEEYKLTQKDSQETRGYIFRADFDDWFAYYVRFDYQLTDWQKFEAYRKENLKWYYDIVRFYDFDYYHSTSHNEQIKNFNDFVEVNSLYGVLQPRIKDIISILKEIKKSDLRQYVYFLDDPSFGGPRCGTRAVHNYLDAHPDKRTIKYEDFLYTFIDAGEYNDNEDEYNALKEARFFRVLFDTLRVSFKDIDETFYFKQIKLFLTEMLPKETAYHVASLIDKIKDKFLSYKFYICFKNSIELNFFKDSHFYEEEESEYMVEWYNTRYRDYHIPNYKFAVDLVKHGKIPFIKVYNPDEIKSMFENQVYYVNVENCTDVILFDKEMLLSLGKAMYSNKIEINFKSLFLHEREDKAAQQE